MTFSEFEEACENGTIQDPYSYIERGELGQYARIAEIERSI